jgi:hypothetical protein
MKTPGNIETLGAQIGNCILFAARSPDGFRI